MAEVPLGGNLQDLVNAQQNGVKYLGLLVQALQNAFPRVTGSFTMAAAATKTITDARVNANALVFLQPTNAAAGTLQGSTRCLYISSVSSGSFVVATAAGTNAGGTEQFAYVVWNPV
jgi:hypothetical protein